VTEWNLKTVGTLAGNLCVCQLEDISGQIAFESVVVNKRCNLICGQNKMHAAGEEQLFFSFSAKICDFGDVEFGDVEIMEVFFFDLKGRKEKKGKCFLSLRLHFFLLSRDIL